MSRSLDLLDLGVSERAREVLLVGENQQRRPGQPLLAEQQLQLGGAVLQPHPVRAVHHLLGGGDEREREERETDG